jgi:hypothetical protein
MTREYDRVLDSKKGMKATHTQVRKLISDASFHLDNKDFDRLESVYFKIECLMSSLGESAKVLQERHEQQMDERIAAWESKYTCNPVGNQ